MAAPPPLDTFRQAAYVGRALARRWSQPHHADDFAQEAQLRLLVEWPKLVGRYGNDPPKPVIQLALERRLIDWWRDQIGRKHLKPHASALSIEAIAEQYDAGTIRLDVEDATVDVEAEVCDRDGYGLDDLIDLCVAAFPNQHAQRVRFVCELVAAGTTLAEIGAQLGATESRACQLVAEIGARVKNFEMAAV